MIKFYSDKRIVSEIIRISKNREVIPQYNKGGFGKRPSTLMYKNELLKMVRKGIMSFHISEERWKNPMSLNNVNSRKEMDSLRKGWDFIIDIDTSYIGFARICAEIVVQALEFHNVNNYSIKYSGGTGFHIGVPCESFPEKVNNKLVKNMFPEAAQIMAAYLTNMIKKKLKERILQSYSIKAIQRITKKDKKELIEDDEFNPYSVLEIDSIAISPRHLFRMPYSLNLKKNLVSLPIKRDEIIDFDPESASLDNAEYNGRFLEYDNNYSAKELLVQSLDWFNRKQYEEEKEETKKRKNIKINYDKIEAKYFPPCIKKILKGMEDGRKRAIFIIINFLKGCKYNFDEINKILSEWNNNNKEKISKSYIKSQISWNRKIKTDYLPPNCKNSLYYTDISVCEPDSICKKIKNPLNYSIIKKKMLDKKKYE